MRKEEKQLPALLTPPREVQPGVAAELGVNIRATPGPVLERPGDVAAILSNLREHDLLFIDEIHRLNHVVEESLSPAMEDFQIDILIGQGPSARSIKLNLPH